ncbi:MAG TPA: TonB-dependent receptor plug domain-containing protein, partial [Burkholderiaceae bacterium]
MHFRPNLVALAVLGLVAQAQAQAQTTPPPAAAEPQKIERVEVTGSLIKRTDKETPSVVQTITREDIRESGYATVEDLLRATSVVDTGSIGDGAASGFVGGLSTISLRGFGSQGTLILVNGRRLAPVAAVDVNFGRGSLVSVNAIPKGAIERVDVLKDGASALYGSDAMAGVVNYVLRKDYRGMEANVNVGANERGAGKNQTAGFTFGFGDLDAQRFNVFGGVEAFHRDNVQYTELKNLGDLDTYNQYLNLNSSLARFTPDSVASLYSNYYRVPTSLAGSTTIGGISVA